MIPGPPALAVVARPSARRASSPTAQIARYFLTDDAAAVGRWLEAQGRAGGLDLGSPTVEQRLEIYLDTEVWTLRRSGYQLVASDGPGTFRTLALEPVGGGGPESSDPRYRAEVPREAPLLPVTPNSPLAERVLALGGRLVIQPRVTLRRERQTRRASLSDGFVEVRIDRLRVERGTGTSRDSVHVLAGGRAAEDDLIRQWILALAADCGLTPDSADPLAAVARDLDLPEVGPPEPPPFEVGPAASVVELASTVLALQLARIRVHEPGTRLGDHPESLHDMRVAIRRVRAALALFQDELPATLARLRPRFARVGQALGAVRDLDVQQERVARFAATLEASQREALLPLVARLERHRAAARRALLRRLDAPGWAALLARLDRALARLPRGTPPAGRQPALLDAPGRIRRRRRKLLRRATAVTPESPDETLHELRITGKRLRYALEFHAPLLGAAVRRPCQDLVALQDLLGEHQDAVVAGGQTRELAQRGTLPRQTDFLLGRLAQQHAERTRALRRRLDNALARLRGSRWKRLRRVLERLALDSALGRVE